jgi:hypothetical protein
MVNAIGCSDKIIEMGQGTALLYKRGATSVARCRSRSFRPASRAFLLFNRENMQRSSPIDNDVEGERTQRISKAVWQRGTGWGRLGKRVRQGGQIRKLEGRIQGGAGDGK